MRPRYLPKFALAILALGIGIIFLSGQFDQAAASSYSPQGCYSYAGGYHFSPSYYGYYGYPYIYYNYPYTYCSYQHYAYNYGYSYYGYPYSYSYPYYYSYGYDYYSQPSKYDLTISTDPANLASVSGGGTYDQGSSASFSITRSTVQTTPNARYVFSHWSGDYSGVGGSGTITMNSARKIVAVYQLQYHLDVGVQPQSAPLPQGGGWYNAGDTVTLTAAGQMLGGEDGSRLVFQGWNVDGNSVQGGVSWILKMDSPHAVTAQYKEQYYLKVVTDQGGAYGEGWYDNGATAQIYVSTPVSTSYGVSIIFNGWQGDVQSNSQSTNVLMDKPKTAIASWRTDPTILNLTIALGIIAVFLAGAGIIAYVAVSRNRFRQQEMKPVPQKAASAEPSESPPPTKRKSMPPKKKAVPENSDSEQPPTTT